MSEKTYDGKDVPKSTESVLPARSAHKRKRALDRKLAAEKAKLTKIQLLLSLINLNLGEDSLRQFDLEEDSEVLRQLGLQSGLEEDSEILRQLGLQSGLEEDNEELRQSDLEEDSEELKQFDLEVDLTEQLAEWASVLSKGLRVPKRRSFPIRVYVSASDDILVQQISAAVESLPHSFESELVGGFRPILGSWFKTWVAKTKDALTRPEMAERLQKLERAVELQALGIPQAQIDEKQAAAVATLLKAVETSPTAAIQIGRILVIKIPGINGHSVLVRTLAQKELLEIESNPMLLGAPEELLKRLDHWRSRMEAAASYVDVHDKYDQRPSLNLGEPPVAHPSRENQAR